MLCSARAVSWLGIPSAHPVLAPHGNLYHVDAGFPALGFASQRAQDRADRRPAQVGRFYGSDDLTSCTAYSGQVNVRQYRAGHARSHCRKGCGCRS